VASHVAYPSLHPARAPAPAILVTPDPNDVTNGNLSGVPTGTFVIWLRRSEQRHHQSQSVYVTFYGRGSGLRIASYLTQRSISWLGSGLLVCICRRRCSGHPRLCVIAERSKDHRPGSSCSADLPRRRSSLARNPKYHPATGSADMRTMAPHAARGIALNRQRKDRD